VTPYVWLSLFPEKIKKFQGKEEKNGTSMPALDGSLSIFCLPFIISLHFNKPGKRGDRTYFLLFPCLHDSSFNFPSVKLINSLTKKLYGRVYILCKIVRHLPDQEKFSSFIDIKA